MMSLNSSQIERYSRQILLHNIGGVGQKRLFNGSVLVIGAGGLGSPACYYLAAAGIGTIGIVDDDKVELSNLQRQIIHFTEDINTHKTISVKNKVNSLNPDVNVVTYQERVETNSIEELIRTYDFVIDGTDNFPAKYLINDACVTNGKAFSHGGILRFSGQTVTCLPGSACYRCIFSEPPPEGAVPTCSEAGVLGVVAGVLGTIQAAEALKYILGIGNQLSNRLLIVDMLDMQIQTIGIEKNENCTLCGDR